MSVLYIGYTSCIWYLVQIVSHRRESSGNQLKDTRARRKNSEHTAHQDTPYNGLPWRRSTISRDRRMPMSWWWWWWSLTLFSISVFSASPFHCMFIKWCASLLHFSWPFTNFLARFLLFSASPVHHYSMVKWFNKNLTRLPSKQERRWLRTRKPLAYRESCSLEGATGFIQSSIVVLALQYRCHITISHSTRHKTGAYLCFPVPMFPGTDVPRTYVPRCLCSPVPMFPGTDVPRPHI